MEIRKEDKTITEAAAKEHIHYSLNNILIRPGKLVATNGRILVVREVNMEEGEIPFDDILLDAKTFKRAIADGGILTPGENGTVKIQSANGNNGHLIPNGSETILHREEGTFPDYKRVIPPEEREGQITIKVSPTYLTRILKTFKGTDSIQISIRGKDEAIRLDATTEHGKKIIGVLMPLVNN